MTSASLFDLDDSFARQLAELGVVWKAVPVRRPELLILNDELAVELGLDPVALASPEGVAVLAGNVVVAGPEPFAMAYAGHQFGGYSPQLGDGRALLLGEVLDVNGQRRDIHLKGSGRTPFARGGDGRAAVGPMLREYLVAEAMHALGIPTARALAVVATGEAVLRDGGPVPGAVLTRVAASHLRIGTFEYAVRSGGPELVRRLADHAIDRHAMPVDGAERRYLAILEQVVDAQAALVAQWMLVGFIHGVMNTDNMTISGETIDYGPCAFMDRYDPGAVFSSIDHGGRYAYGNQPGIAQWNLARLAETLLELIDDDPDTATALAVEVLETFPDRFGRRLLSGLAAKLGVPDCDDSTLFDDYLALLAGEQLDFTTSFRSLARSLRGDDEPWRSQATDVGALDEWTARWRQAVDASGRSPGEVADRMDGVNPIYIPRNHLVEEALDAGTAGDLAPFRDLLELVTAPYEERPGKERFAEPAPAEFADRFQTFCGT